MKKISAFIAFALILTVVRIHGTGLNRLTSSQANAGKASSYSFTAIAFLDNPAPGGGNFTFDFEPNGLNNSGEAAFTADLTDSDGNDAGEGVFVAQNGQLTQIFRHDQPAPGGSTFGPFELGRWGLNEGGDLAIPFSLNIPDTIFGGQLVGLFGFSHSKQLLRAVALPGDPAPGGGQFYGVYSNTYINNRGDIPFAGIVTGGDIDPSSPPGEAGLGVGLFLADKAGTVSSVARPGDAAPGGRIFDMAMNGSINNGGDIAFGGHVAGDECVDIGFSLLCGESVYLKDAASGIIRSIAHQGDTAPGGGIYRLAFGAVVNSGGDIVFIGDVTPAPNSGDALGVFLFSKGTTIAVARPGDAMPGGGTFVRAGFQDATYDLNQSGDVSFGAALSTDDNGDGEPDTGIYVFSKSSVRLVARTGTVVPGLGTISYLGLPPPNPSLFGIGAVMNDRGQVLFSATFDNGTTALLVATP